MVASGIPRYRNKNMDLKIEKQGTPKLKFFKFEDSIAYIFGIPRGLTIWNPGKLIFIMGYCGVYITTTIIRPNVPFKY